MRVSKTVKAYIEKRVQDALSVKYQDEKEKWAVMQSRRDVFIKNLKRAGQDAMVKYIEVHKAALSDILDMEYTERDLETSIGWRCFDFLGGQDGAHCSHYNRRFDKEVQENVERIVVELELGGTKEDLERLLSAI